MNALLVPFGSAGDVHPFIGLGLELKKRGHRVTILTSGYFQSIIEAAGFEFVPTSTAEEFTSVLDHPDLWHPLRALPFLAKVSIVPQVRPIYELVMKHYRPRETVVAAGSLAFGARVAQDKHNIPLATIHLQPSVLRSVYDPPTYAAIGRVPDWVPIPLKRLFFRLQDVAADGWFAEGINTFRAELGLVPVKRILGSWWNSPQLTIGMFPEWFAAPQKDWPAAVRLTGFPLYDGAGLEKSAPDVEEFLKAGEPPIVFTAGSAMKTGNDFFRHSVSACESLGRRGILLTRFTDQLPKPLPPQIRHFSYAPFSQVLPHAAAFVHHGGIGTTSQALKAGVPQLIVPFSHDQPDNAVRVEKLGCGKSLLPTRYKPDAVATALRELITDGKFKKNCADVVKKFTGEPALQKTADLIEELCRGGPPRPPEATFTK